MTKGKRGRPKKSRAERRGITLSIRLTAAERRELSAVAKEASPDLTVSEWAREALLTHRTRPPEPS